MGWLRYMHRGAALRRPDLPDLPLSSGAPTWTQILNADHDAVALGTMTGTKMGTLFPGETFGNGYPGFSRMVIVNDAQRGQVMRIDFTGGLGNPDEAIAIFPTLHFESYPGGFAVAKDRAVRMTDWMKYPTSFMFPPAAKTPGIGGNINAASDGQASGGQGLETAMVDAMSCRIMTYSAPAGNWSTGIPGFTSSLSGRNNRLAMYSYYNNMGSSFGKDFWDPDPGAPGHWPSSLSGSPSRAFGDGQWHKRTLVLVPNTFSGGSWQADGKIRFYLDDVLIHTYDNIPWRSQSGLWVNKYWLHHFFGGSGAGYESPQTQSYFYDGPIVEFANFDGWTAD